MWTNPYARRGIVILVVMVLGYFLSFSPQVAAQLAHLSFAMLLAICFALFVG
jgi:hypothetical protein